MIPDQDVAVLALRVLAALVFATSAVGQLRDRSIFAGVIANYQILPATFAPLAAVALPMAEICVAVGFFVWPPVAHLAAALLLAVFAVAMAVNLRRGRTHIDCGCHQGASKQNLRWVLVGRNVVLAAVLAATAPLAVAADLLSLSSGAAAGAAAFSIYLAVNALWALGRPPARRVIHISGVH